MPKDYALRKLHSKEKIIFCGCYKWFINALPT